MVPARRPGRPPRPCGQSFANGAACRKPARRAASSCCLRRSLRRFHRSRSRVARANSSRRRAISSWWRLISSSRSLRVGRVRSSATHALCHIPENCTSPIPWICCRHPLNKTIRLMFFSRRARRVRSRLPPPPPRPAGARTPGIGPGLTAGFARVGSDFRGCRRGRQETRRVRGEVAAGGPRDRLASPRVSHVSLVSDGSGISRIKPLIEQQPVGATPVPDS